jgi:seryl-tRNA synthetase
VYDIKWIRENREAFDAGMAKRGFTEVSSEDLIALNDKRRAHTTKLQEMQTERNAKSKEIGKAKGQKDEETAQRLMAEVAALKSDLQEGEAQEREIESGLRDLLATIPNLPLEDVPEGKDEDDNVEVRKVGEPKAFDFEAKEHFDIGEALGLMDFEAASRMSGARFVVLKGALARLERALAQFMLNLHTAPANGQLGGYEEVNPPMLVRDEAMFGTGQLPKFEDDLFQTCDPAFQLDRYNSMIATGISQAQAKYREAEEKQEGKGSDALLGLDPYDNKPEPQIDPSRHWLIPTAEVPLTNLVNGQTLDAADLPLRYTAHTPCFRSEAGAAGRDTRGMIRQHQFSKVELVSITRAEDSLDELERMTASAEKCSSNSVCPTA